MKPATKIALGSLFLSANISLLLLLASEITAQRPRNSAFIARRVYDDPLENIQAFSLPGREEDFLVATLPKFEYPSKSKEILFFSPFERTQKQLSFLLHLRVPLNFRCFPPLDVNGDGRVEIPLLHIRDRRLRLELRDFSGKTIRTVVLEALSLPLPSDLLPISPLDITDLDLDGRFEVLCMVSGEFMGLPRGIAAFDLASGKRKWDFLFGAVPFQATAIDLDDDGRKEVVFSAWAPHNGFTHNGMNDDTSYLGVLGSDGRPRWVQEAGGYFSEIHFAVADLNRDGRREIVSARACHRKIEPDPGEIRVLNALDGSLLRSLTRQDDSFTRPFIADVDAAPGPEIVVGNATGLLMVLDGELRSIRQVQLGDRVNVLSVAPLPGGRENGIAARVGSGAFALLDGDLEPLFRHRNPSSAGGTIQLLPVRGRVGRSLLLNADRPYFISKNPGATVVPAVFRSPGFSLALILGLAFNAVFLLHLRARRRAPAALRENSGWLRVTQEMVHRMKTPMTNILWEAERLKAGLAGAEAPATLSESLKRTPDSLINELKELKLMNRYLMKFLQIQSPKFKKGDLNALLRETAEKYSRHLGERIRFQFSLDESIPLLAMDEEQMSEVFINLIENAIDAMPAGGEIAISSRWRTREGKGAAVVIRDSGRGMAEEEIKMIFTPNFTSKKEGFGIGLPVCQRILAAHGGTIAVESRVGVGTKIAIFIPWEPGAPRHDE